MAKNVSLVARLQLMDNVASLLPLYLEGVHWPSAWKWMKKTKGIHIR